MKVLVIGVKGFIGSHLMDHLESKGHDVFGADVIVDYSNPRYFQIDSTNSDFQQVFLDGQFDLCVNCSGAASVPDSINNPMRDYSLNSVNVFKILDSIRKHNPGCKLINLSSAAVYGNPDSLPVKEDSSLNPMSPYGYHKKNSEVICEEFHRFFQVKVCSLRIFSAFGEGLRKQLFWDLYQKALKSNDVDLFGTGKESRDFIYVGDLVRLIEIVAENCSFEADVINAANGQEVTIRTAVETFLKLWNPEVKVIFTGLERKGDPNRWVADISKLKEMGYTQSFTLESGLNRYCNWLRGEQV